MRQFITLLKKEILELLTPQLIIPFVVVVFLFSMLGNFLKEQSTKQGNEKIPIVLIDLDNSELSKKVNDILTNSNFKINQQNFKNQDQAKDFLNQNKLISAVIIPNNFEKNYLNNQETTFVSYTNLINLSLTNFDKYSASDQAIQFINQAFSNQLLNKQLPTSETEFIKNPVKQQAYTIISNKSAQINISQVITFINQQITFIPIILFLVIVLAAQMIASAVATEKENKTLETLLSSPIDRKIIVSAKMVAAGIIAIFMAGIYMFGYKSYIDGLTSSTTENLQNISNYISQLGLSFSTYDYLILALALFVSILVALAFAIILGGFAQDAKSAQGVITPLMVLIMIPYFLTMFIDINSLEPIYKYLIYAIPFSHAFLAAPNIMLGNLTFVYWGILYQLLFFIALIYLAAKIFSSDYIMTMKIDFNFFKKINKTKKIKGEQT